jgi:flagellar basal-body rod modification protein FlgD
LKLLTTELTHQDPFEPTDNAALLEQLSSIRNMELSTTLTDSLRSLTDQQRFGSASALIGQSVTSAPNEVGQSISGMVIGIQFQADGQVVLRLSTGDALTLDQLASIEPPLQAAERLVGHVVAGVDRRLPTEPVAVEGLVTAVRLDENGEALLELDSGGDIRLRDVLGTIAQAAA